MPKTIDQIKNFGQISAEDDNIRKYFVSTPVFKNLLSGDKQIVLGRKGSGKTALYLALLDQGDKRGYFASGLSFKDYPWGIHDRYVSDEVTKQERYSPSWQFLVYMELFKILLTDKDRLHRYSSRGEAVLKSVEEFIKKNYGMIAFDYKKMFPEGGFKLDGIKFEPQIAGFGLGGGSVARGDALGKTISRLNDWLQNSLLALEGAPPKIFLLFDELDIGYSPESEEYKDRVIGLLVTIRSMTRAFATKEMPFSLVGFLRTDIFDRLHFGDKNKISENNAEYLIWNDDLIYHDCSLKELIDQRIREEMDLSDSEQDPWGYAFDSRQMRGTQHKFNHITFRGYLRPRDMIKFCNSALQEAKKRLALDQKIEKKISNEDIRTARKVYSKYLLKELDDEVAAVDENWQSYVELLRNVGKNRFFIGDFINKYGSQGVLYGLKKTPGEILALLFNFGVIGFQRAAGASGLVDHFRYYDESIPFDLNAREFVIHRGLKEVLEVAEVGSGTGGALEDEL